MKQALARRRHTKPSAMPSANVLRLRTIPLFAAAAFAVDSVRCQPMAAEAEPVVQTITLEQAVRIALASNLGLAVQRFSQDSARESVVIADAGYDPTVGLNSRRGYARSQSANALDANESDDFSTVLSASKRIDTGATVSLNTLVSRSDNNRAGNLYDPTFTSDFSLTIQQPLLQGAGTAVNRAARQRARIGVEGSDLSFAVEAMNVIRDTEIAFYDLAYALRNLEVQRNGLAVAVKFQAENEARREAGLTTELDVMQARVGVANRQALIVTAEQRVRDAADVLLVLLGQQEFTGLPNPQGIAFGQGEPVDMGKSYGKALQNDPDIQVVQSQIKQLELDVTVAASERRPRVDLGGTLGLTGVNDTLPGANDALASGESYDWRVDLVVSMPWGMREGRARHRIAKLSLEQQRARLRQLEQNLLVRVRAAVRAVETDQLSVETYTVASDLSLRQLDLERAKYQAGLSTSYFVVDAQQAADEALIRKTQAQILSEQDRARLRRLEGASLTAYGLVLPAPEQK
jgi:outer membrane protein